MSAGIGVLGGLAGALTLASGAFAAFSIKQSADFQHETEALQSFSHETEAQLAADRDRILQISIDTGGTTAELAKDYLSATEAQYKGADAAKVVTAAQEGAVAAHQQAADVMRPLIELMRGYHDTANQAMTVQDELSVATNLAGGSFTQMNRALRQSILTATEMNFSSKDLLGTIDALSLGGTQLWKAGTEVSTLFTTLQSRLVESNITARHLNVTFADLHTRGITDVAETFRAIDEAIKTTTATIKDHTKAQEAYKTEAMALLGSGPGFKEFMQLQKDGFKSLDADIKAVTDSQGKVAEGFKQAEETFSHEGEHLKTTLEDIGIIIGTDVLPPLTEATHIFVEGGGAIAGFLLHNEALVSGLAHGAIAIAEVVVAGKALGALLSFMEGAALGASGKFLELGGSTELVARAELKEAEAALKEAEARRAQQVATGELAGANANLSSVLGENAAAQGRVNEAIGAAAQPVGALVTVLGPLPALLTEATTGSAALFDIAEKLPVKLDEEATSLKPLAERLDPLPKLLTDTATGSAALFEATTKLPTELDKEALSLKPLAGLLEPLPKLFYDTATSNAALVEAILSVPTDLDKEAASLAPFPELLAPLPALLTDTATASTALFDAIEGLPARLDREVESLLDLPALLTDTATASGALRDAQGPLAAMLVEGADATVAWRAALGGVAGTLTTTAESAGTLVEAETELEGAQTSLGEVTGRTVASLVLQRATLAENLIQIIAQRQELSLLTDTTERYLAVAARAGQTTSANPASVETIGALVNQQQQATSSGAGMAASQDALAAATTRLAATERELGGGIDISTTALRNQATATGEALGPSMALVDVLTIERDRVLALTGAWVDLTTGEQTATASLSTLTSLLTETTTALERETGTIFAQREAITSLARTWDQLAASEARASQGQIASTDASNQTATNVGLEHQITLERERAALSPELTADTVREASATQTLAEASATLAPALAEVDAGLARVDQALGAVDAPMASVNEEARATTETFGALTAAAWELEDVLVVHSLSSAWRAVGDAMVAENSQELEQLRVAAAVTEATKTKEKALISGTAAQETDTASVKQTIAVVQDQIAHYRDLEGAISQVSAILKENTATLTETGKAALYARDSYTLLETDVISLQSSLAALSGAETSAAANTSLVSAFGDLRTVVADSTQGIKTLGVGLDAWGTAVDTATLAENAFVEGLSTGRLIVESSARAVSDLAKVEGDLASAALAAGPAIGIEGDALRALAQALGLASDTTSTLTGTMTDEQTLLAALGATWTDLTATLDAYEASLAQIQVQTDISTASTSAWDDELRSVIPSFVTLTTTLTEGKTSSAELVTETTLIVTGFQAETKASAEVVAALVTQIATTRDLKTAQAEPVPVSQTAPGTAQEAGLTGALAAQEQASAALRASDQALLDVQTLLGQSATQLAERYATVTESLGPVASAQSDWIATLDVESASIDAVQASVGGLVTGLDLLDGSLQTAGTAYTTTDEKQQIFRTSLTAIAEQVGVTGTTLAALAAPLAAAVGAEADLITSNALLLASFRAIDDILVVHSVNPDLDEYAIAAKASAEASAALATANEVVAKTMADFDAEIVATHVATAVANTGMLEWQQSIRVVEAEQAKADVQLKQLTVDILANKEAAFANRTENLALIALLKERGASTEAVTVATKAQTVADAEQGSVLEGLTLRTLAQNAASAGMALAMGGAIPGLNLLIAGFVAYQVVSAVAPKQTDDFTAALGRWIDGTGQAASDTQVYVDLLKEVPVAMRGVIEADQKQIETNKLAVADAQALLKAQRDLDAAYKEHQVVAGRFGVPQGPSELQRLKDIAAAEKELAAAREEAGEKASDRLREEDALSKPVIAALTAETNLVDQMTLKYEQATEAAKQAAQAVSDIQSRGAVTPEVAKEQKSGDDMLIQAMKALPPEFSAVVGTQITSFFEQLKAEQAWNRDVRQKIYAEQAALDKEARDKEQQDIAAIKAAGSKDAAAQEEKAAQLLGTTLAHDKEQRDAELSKQQTLYNDHIAKLKEALGKIADPAGLWDEVKKEATTLATESMARLEIALSGGASSVDVLTASAAHDQKVLNDHAEIVRLATIKVDEALGHYAAVNTSITSDLDTKLRDAIGKGAQDIIYHGGATQADIASIREHAGESDKWTKAIAEMTNISKTLGTDFTAASQAATKLATQDLAKLSEAELTHRGNLESLSVSAIHASERTDDYAEAQRKAQVIVDEGAGRWKAAFDLVDQKLTGDLNNALAHYATDLQNHSGNLAADAAAISRDQTQVTAHAVAMQHAKDIAAQTADTFDTLDKHLQTESTQALIGWETALLAGGQAVDAFRARSIELAQEQTVLKEVSSQAAQQIAIASGDVVTSFDAVKKGIDDPLTQAIDQATLDVQAHGRMTAQDTEALRSSSLAQQDMAAASTSVAEKLKSFQVPSFKDEQSQATKNYQDALDRLALYLEHGKDVVGQHADAMDRNRQQLEAMSQAALDGTKRVGEMTTSIGLDKQATDDHRQSLVSSKAELDDFGLRTQRAANGVSDALTKMTQSQATDFQTLGGATLTLAADMVRAGGVVAASHEKPPAAHATTEHATKAAAALDKLAQSAERASEKTTSKPESGALDVDTHALSGHSTAVGGSTTAHRTHQEVVTANTTYLRNHAESVLLDTTANRDHTTSTKSHTETEAQIVGAAVRAYQEMIAETKTMDKALDIVAEKLGKTGDWTLYEQQQSKKRTDALTEDTANLEHALSTHTGNIGALTAKVAHDEEAIKHHADITQHAADLVAATMGDWSRVLQDSSQKLTTDWANAVAKTTLDIERHGQATDADRVRLTELAVAREHEAEAAKRAGEEEINAEIRAAKMVGDLGEAAVLTKNKVSQEMTDAANAYTGAVESGATDLRSYGKALDKAAKDQESVHLAEQAESARQVQAEIKAAKAAGDFAEVASLTKTKISTDMTQAVDGLTGALESGVTNLSSYSAALDKAAAEQEHQSQIDAQVADMKTEAEIRAARAAGDLSTAFSKTKSLVDGEVTKSFDALSEHFLTGDGNLIQLTASYELARAAQDANTDAVTKADEATGQWAQALQALQSGPQKELADAQAKYAIDLHDHTGDLNADRAAIQQHVKDVQAWSVAVQQAADAAKVVTQSQVDSAQASIFSAQMTEIASETALISAEGAATVAGITDMTKSVQDQTSIMSAESAVSTAQGAGMLSAIADQSGIIQAASALATATGAGAKEVAQATLTMARDKAAIDARDAAAQVRLAELGVKLAQDRASADAANAGAQEKISADHLQATRDQIVLDKDHLQIAVDSLAALGDIAYASGSMTDWQKVLAADLSQANADQRQIAADNRQLAVDTTSANQIAAQGNLQQALDSQSQEAEKASAAQSSQAGQITLALDQQRVDAANAAKAQLTATNATTSAVNNQTAALTAQLDAANARLAIMTQAAYIERLGFGRSNVQGVPFDQILGGLGATAGDYHANVSV